MPALELVPKNLLWGRRRFASRANGVTTVRELNVVPALFYVFFPVQAGPGANHRFLGFRFSSDLSPSILSRCGNWIVRWNSAAVSMHFLSRCWNWIAIFRNRVFTTDHVK